MEGIPEGLLDAPQIRIPRVRPVVVTQQRIGRRPRVEMEREPVHQRRRPPGLAVPRPERAEEAHRRGGEVASRRRVVVPARGKPDADDGDVRVDVLQRVVGGGEVAAERGRRQHHPLLRELRPPERRLVRLVADHELRHLRKRARDDGDVLGEGAHLRLRPRERPRRVRVHGEDDLEPQPVRLGHGLVEERLALDRVRLARDEAHGHHGLLQADRGHLLEERAAAVLGELARVVVRADVCGPGGARARQHESGECGGDDGVRTRVLPHKRCPGSPERGRATG